MKRSLIALVGASGILLSSCTTIIDSHGNGSSPAGPGDLPGPPPGDSMSAAGQVLFNGGSMQLSATSGTQTGVAFRPDEDHGNQDEYTLSFAGVITLITAQPVVAVDVFDTSQRLGCGIEISGGEFRLVSGNGTNVIGSYSAQADEHRVILRIADRCFVNIRQFGQGLGPNSPQTAPVIEASAPLAASDFGILERVQVAYEQVTPDTPGSYFVGRLTVSAN
ncbi:MAG: hypothetical protein WBB25_15055 [Sulfitobacter sp.]